MFQPLFSRMRGEFHMFAPDYPGFGQSDAPSPKETAYTFDNIAKVMDHFTEAMGLTRYTLYMQDYGGPVGFRMALAHPDRTEALIVQDAVAHNDDSHDRPRGLSEHAQSGHAGIGDGRIDGFAPCPARDADSGSADQTRHRRGPVRPVCTWNG
jgi:pimeloyl-ACP methyl ester carboxylesterase